MTPLEYFEKQYLPMFELAPSRERLVRLAMRLFERFCPGLQIESMTDDDVAEFGQRLRAARRSENVVSQRTRDVLYILADAYRRGFNPTPPAIPAKALLRVHRHSERLRGVKFRRGSLLRYFQRKFVPTALEYSTKRQIKYYRNAIHKLCDYLGRDVVLSEVNDVLLDSFWSWCRNHLEAHTATQYRQFVRAVIRHAKPNRMAKSKRQTPGAQESPAIDADELNVDGSLYRFWREVYLPKRMVGATGGSAAQHVYAIRRLCKFAKRSVAVDELNDDLLSAHFQWMLDRGMSRATVNSARASLLAIWREAYRQELVDKLPTIKKLKGHKRLPTAWTIRELEALLAACQEAGGRIGEQRASDYWTALVLFLYDTGIRIRSALLVEMKRVDLNTGWVTVEADTQKQKVEQRFRLTEQTIAAVARIMEPARNLLFYWPMGRNILYRHFSRILKAAGLPTDRRHKFHQLRRTCCTHIAAAVGIDAAAKHLGHSSVDVTDRYVDPRFLADHDTTKYLPRPKLNGSGEGGVR